MTDKTYKIIEELAAKLNTSTEVLWSALLKQAKIEFYTNISFYAIGIVLAVVAVRLIIKHRDDDEYLLRFVFSHF